MFGHFVWFPVALSSSMVGACFHLFGTVSDVSEMFIFESCSLHSLHGFYVLKKVTVKQL